MDHPHGRREFLQRTAAGLAAAALASGLSQPSRAADAPSAATAPVIGGSGAFRFQYVPDKLVLPPECKMKNGHGLTIDPAGNIYFTFEPEKVDADTRVLVRFAPDGAGPTLLGPDNALAHGVPHGLSIHTDPKGESFLYHANNNRTIHKTTLDGKIVWTRSWPAFMGNFHPTEAIASPDGKLLFVADGYGSSMIHVLNAADGVYAGRSWGGAGDAHGQFHCPHAVMIDPRKDLLFVQDRANHRMEYFSFDGVYRETVKRPQIDLPCNADPKGENLLVPALDGPVHILDKDNQVVSTVEVAKLLGEKGFHHPHDAVWLAGGDIAVCTWNPGRLSYWKRLPEA